MGVIYWRRMMALLCQHWCVHICVTSGWMSGCPTYPYSCTILDWKRVGGQYKVRTLVHRKAPRQSDLKQSRAGSGKACEADPERLLERPWDVRCDVEMGVQGAWWREWFTVPRAEKMPDPEDRGTGVVVQFPEAERHQSHRSDNKSKRPSTTRGKPSFKTQ